MDDDVGYIQLHVDECECVELRAMRDELYSRAWAKYNRTREDFLKLVREHVYRIHEKKKKLFSRRYLTKQEIEDRVEDSMNSTRHGTGGRYAEFWLRSFEYTRDHTLEVLQGVFTLLNGGSTVFLSQHAWAVVQRYMREDHDKFVYKFDITNIKEYVTI